MADIKSNEHLKKAGELFKQKEYDLCLEELDIVLKEDPKNSYALAAREKVRTEQELMRGSNQLIGRRKSKRNAGLPCRSHKRQNTSSGSPGLRKKDENGEKKNKRKIRKTRIFLHQNRSGLNPVRGILTGRIFL
jgi:hypothetical protein